MFCPALKAFSEQTNVVEVSLLHSICTDDTWGGEFFKSLNFKSCGCCSKGDWFGCRKCQQ